jgi:hypothetical protein
MLIIFLLGWPLEWTEIIIIFVPLFLPLLPHFKIDPLRFGILVAVNLQTAFLSPPVAMAVFYLKGVSPPSVLFSKIYWGLMPFMLLQGVRLLIVFFPHWRCGSQSYSLADKRGIPTAGIIPTWEHSPVGPGNPRAPVDIDHIAGPLLGYVQRLQASRTTLGLWPDRKSAARNGRGRAGLYPRG